MPLRGYTLLSILPVCCSMESLNAIFGVTMTMTMLPEAWMRGLDVYPGQDRSGRCGQEMNGFQRVFVTNGTAQVPDKAVYVTNGTTIPPQRFVIVTNLSSLPHDVRVFVTNGTAIPPQEEVFVSNFDDLRALGFRG